MFNKNDICIASFWNAVFSFICVEQIMCRTQFNILISWWRPLEQECGSWPSKVLRIFHLSFHLISSTYCLAHIACCDLSLSLSHTHTHTHTHTHSDRQTDADTLNRKRQRHFTIHLVWLSRLLPKSTGHQLKKSLEDVSSSLACLCWNAIVL